MSTTSENDPEHIKKEDEEHKKKMKEWTTDYGSVAANFISKDAMSGQLPKYKVGTLVHNINSPKNEDGTMVDDLKVTNISTGPNGWSYELEDINDPTEYIPRHDEWKINWEPGQPKFANGSKVKFKSIFSALGNKWTVVSYKIDNKTYKYVYELKGKANTFNNVKEDELQAATQGGGRRRKTMKKSRKMRRKTNKKVRKMRRKSMKKSHKKK